MKRKLFVLLMALCLLMGLVLTAHATSDHLLDGAGLLSYPEASNLGTKLSQISDRHDVDVVIVTVDSTMGASPMDFADDCYDYGGYRADGILLLISMEDSDWWVSTTGYGITAVTDAGLDYMADRFTPYLSEGDFDQAFHEFADLCDKFLTQAKTGDPYDRHNLPKHPFRLFRNLVISLVLGLTSALIATGIMKSKLKTVRQQAKADDYMVPGSLHLTHSRDLFLYTHLDRREKPKSSSGSSTHTSSSGTTHGGGGGKF